MGARAIAWAVLLAVTTAVVLVACVIISSSLSFFNEEAFKVTSKLDNAPQLRSVVEQTLRFVKSFIWTIFILLVVALIVSLLVLWLEDVASR